MLILSVPDYRNHLEQSDVGVMACWNGTTQMASPLVFFWTTWHSLLRHISWTLRGLKSPRIASPKSGYLVQGRSDKDIRCSMSSSWCGDWGIEYHTHTATIDMSQGSQCIPDGREHLCRLRGMNTSLMYSTTPPPRREVKFFWSYSGHCLWY